ncbi:MAG TPA: hypothetical protein VKS60_12660 [Stellaceae bacterium]|nr:hypothetical protein [Stellaceae bacterium]
MDTAAAPDEPPAPDPAAELLGILRSLTQMGMRIAAELERQIINQQPTLPQGADPVKQFADAAKAVRLTVALEARLREGIAAETRKDRRIAPWRAALAGAMPWPSPPGEVPRIIERLIESECDPDEIAALVTELREAAMPRPGKEPGLSAATVNMIKRQILGIRDDPPAAPAVQPPRGAPSSEPPRPGVDPPPPTRVPIR